jgi:hypothetical protein
MDLHTSIAKDVKNQQLFMDLHVGIVMDVKKPATITRPTCQYYNGCKKSHIYYETYM